MVKTMISYVDLISGLIAYVAVNQINDICTMRGDSREPTEIYCTNGRVLYSSESLYDIQFKIERAKQP